MLVEKQAAQDDAFKEEQLAALYFNADAMLIERAERAAHKETDHAN